MDPIKNPFSPGAGTPPPELVGRERILEQAEILFGRVLAGRSEKSLMLTGLRGVGKTVLLCRLEQLAQQKGFLTIFTEAGENDRVGEFLVQGLRKILLDLNLSAKAKEKIRKALIALRNFAGTLSLKIGDVGIGAEPILGLADSGSLESDLTELLLLAAEAAQTQKRAIAIFIDEIQYFAKEEFSALIMAFHRIQQRGLPMVIVGAGLPQLPALAGDLKSYSERLFSFPKIGALSRSDAQDAVVIPIRQAGEKIERAAVNLIFEKTQGYPYFIQEWAYRAWLMTEDGAVISKKIVQSADKDVLRRLDESFFHVRYDRLTPGEKIFLRYMAEASKGEPLKMEDMVAVSKGKSGSLAQVKKKLEDKGMIYAPRYGVFDFTVPLFGDFMKRIMPLPKTPARSRGNAGKKFRRV